MKGWILYKRNRMELGLTDHGVMRLLEAASAMGCDMEVYRPEQFDLIASNDFRQSLFLNGEPVLAPDFLIPRIGAETSAFALALVRHIELLGVRVFNGARSIGICGNKMHMGQLLSAHGFPVPKTLLVRPPVSWMLIREQIGFPLIIKKVYGAKGVGVHLCESESAFRDVMELLTLDEGTSGILIQQFIAESYGRDVRIFVIGDKAVGCMQRVAKEGFKANFSLGGTVSSWPMTAEMAAMAIKASNLAGLDISGVDLLFGPDGFLICEVNSSPGFNGMEQATCVDIAEQIMRHVRTSLEQTLP